jgi:hypothetical protein
MEANFALKRFQKAHLYSKALIALKYPSEEHAVLSSIHCALEAQLYQEALEHSQFYLQKWPANELVQSITERLKSGKDLEQLKLFFKTTKEIGVKK